ncbi:hypothetical protein AB4Z51_34620 [Bradyrhizobium sp. 2TAF36]|uniref:hypothetical protein n=1 Tax=Bradyrhizobium sp. 2TAF36 TaxID=3233016 RepID=UPI003F911D6C
MRLAETRPYANPESRGPQTGGVSDRCRAGSGRANSYREDQRAIPVHAQGKSSEVGAGLEFALDRGWLELHESDTYVWILAQGIDLFPRQ